MSSKKSKQQAADMVERAVGKVAKKIQEDPTMDQATKDKLLAKNARAVDEVRKKMGTD